MGKLPKSIIKKYGISKKAWAVYRSGRSRTTTRRKRAKPLYRRTTKRYTMVKRKSRPKQTMIGQAKKLIRPLALGAGAALLIGAASSRIAAAQPYQAPIEWGSALVFGGPMGLVGKGLVDALQGKLDIPFVGNLMGNKTTNTNGDGW